MKLLSDVIRKNKIALLVFFAVSALNLTVFLLYEIALEPFVYSVVLSFCCMCLFFMVALFKEKRRSDIRRNAVSAIKTNNFSLPPADCLAEKDYLEMLEILRCELQRVTDEYNSEKQDAFDYYTAWVHQIKTPIAVMRLQLSEDTPENRAVLAEVFRIEQYVDMALQYIRLGSDSNDLVIREYPVDGMVRETVRKFAPQFVEKKLTLTYEPTEETAVTDRKWLCFIMEQLISNAIKYTQSGGITITVNGNRIRIADTGIGIAPEDMPRIFEKGFTGSNGRIGQKSSGLGLFLCRKAAELINVKIEVESEPGKGSCFELVLPRKQ